MATNQNTTNQVTFTRAQVRKIAFRNLFGGLFIGIGIIPLILLLFPEEQIGNFPLEVAAQMKDRFKHEWIIRWNYPKTEFVIHDIAKLQTYINAIKHKYPALYTEKDTVYNLGIGFYPARSFKENYVRKFPNDTAYLLKKRYTVFLTPVYYNTTDSSIEYKENGKTEKLNVKVLKDVRTPLDSIEGRGSIYLNVFKQFSAALNSNDNYAFDLGHTKP